MVDEQGQELENTIIAYFLMSMSSRSKIAEIVQAEYFANDEIKTIADKLLSSYNQSPNADPSVLIDNLTQEQKLYCVDCCKNVLLLENVISDDTLLYFANTSRERLYREKLQEAIMLSNYDIDAIQGIYDSYKPITRNISSIDDYINHFSEVADTYNTGFWDIDRTLSTGLMAGTIMAIGARPSVGKTTFAINLATAQDSETKIGFFSLEMSASMIYDRLLANKCNIDYTTIAKHNMFDSETANGIFDVLREYENITVYDDIYNIENIVTYIKTNKFNIVFIDYIQIIRSINRFTDNRQRIDYISQALKKCAKDTKCLIVILSQVTRAGKDCPTMSDLKESGGLEQDSDYVLMLDRPYVNDKGNPDLDESYTIVKLDKNKFGRTGKFELKFEGAYQRFVDPNAISRLSSSNNIADDDLPF